MLSLAVTWISSHASASFLWFPAAHRTFTPAPPRVNPHQAEPKPPPPPPPTPPSPQGCRQRPHRDLPGHAPAKPCGFCCSSAARLLPLQQIPPAFCLRRCSLARRSDTSLVRLPRSEPAQTGSAQAHMRPPRMPVCHPPPHPPLAPGQKHILLSSRPSVKINRRTSLCKQPQIRWRTLGLSSNHAGPTAKTHAVG